MALSGPVPTLSIGESLQEYAARTSRHTRAAYTDWHAHGNTVAADWSKREPSDPDLALRGGRSLGLLASDVGSLAGETR